MAKDQLGEIMKKLEREKKENPFTTSIRIEKDVYEEVLKYLKDNGLNFSDFVNEWLKDILEQIKEKEKAKKKS